MIPYTYLSTAQCMEQFPLVYHDAEQEDKRDRYLILHEVRDRHMNNWQVKDQWEQYRGIITWNHQVYKDHKRKYNMLYCRQFMNMSVEEAPEYVEFSNRPFGLCAMYGKPASIDTEIMMARYDVPLRLALLGLNVNTYGVIPDQERPEYREGWRKLWRGGLPIHGKHMGLMRHRFGIAFENSRDPYFALGWVTEKIYDCLGSGCIPIYWGAPNIEEYVPAEVFIDWRDFQDADDLYHYLVMTPISKFERMSREGYEFFCTVHFDDYLNLFRMVARIHQWQVLPRVNSETTLSIYSATK